MGMYAVDTADPAELAALGNAARNGRAAATLRRRALSQGKQALNGGGNGAAAVNGAGAPPAAENLQANGAGAPPVASNGHGASNGTQEVRREPAAAAAGDGLAAAHFGRNVSKERRRQLSLGKQALKGAEAAPVASNGHGASNGTQEVRREPAAAGDGLAAAQFGRNVSKERRRQLSLGKQALKGADAAPVASNGHGASKGTQEVSRETAGASHGVDAAQFGRNVSKERRRQLSLGKQALKGADAAPVASNGHGASKGTQEVSGETAGASDGLAAAQFGRAVSMERRRQLSQGKQALSAGGERTRAAAGAGTGAPAPAPEKMNVDSATSGREHARARRAEASRLGSAGVGRPQREGRVAYPPKVIVSPTHRDQRVTGLRIGQGEQVTGDEPGAALPVTGTQYVPADGPAPPLGAGPKVGRVRTPKGLVVSGTTVRGTVPITGDEAGEHLRITGEADQKFADDLTPRPDGTYRPTQFPRRADPHGATAVTVQPQLAASGGAGPGYALAATDGGLPVTGTAVGRSGRVTGNEAGVCRPITGDQYQDPSLLSTECGGIGGGTTPAAFLNRGRLDPVTGGKVTVANTWGGQRVTGPNVEHSPYVTGDEPGSCRPVTGTPYQGPSTVFGWCEPDEGGSAANRLESRPQGVAVTGDLPLHVENVTGTERGYRNDITGSSYYGEMRPADPAGDDAATWQGFSVPVALARRLVGRESGDARQEADDRAPASCTPGGITGSFAVGDGMVTGNNEFLFRPRLSNRDARVPVAVTGEGEVAGRPITGSAAAWTHHDLVTGTEGYIAAGRNPTERGGGTQGWAGTRRFKNLATPGPPPGEEKVTGRVGGTPREGARVTVSGGAQG